MTVENRESTPLLRAEEVKAARLALCKQGCHEWHSGRCSDCKAIQAVVVRGKKGGTK